MVPSDTKIYPKLKNKGLLSIEKDMKCEKMRICYKQILYLQQRFYNIMKKHLKRTQTFSQKYFSLVFRDNIRNLAGLVIGFFKRTRDVGFFFLGVNQVHQLELLLVFFRRDFFQNIGEFGAKMYFTHHRTAKNIILKHHSVSCCYKRKVF